VKKPNWSRLSLSLHSDFQTGLTWRSSSPHYGPSFLAVMVTLALHAQISGKDSGLVPQRMDIHFSGPSCSDEHQPTRYGRERRGVRGWPHTSEERS
jgi:hypothetical protein